jgi:5-methylcytosine-specific restriction endonuclease McrA
MKDTSVSIHHVIPRSQEGKTTKSNLAKITKDEHEKYHSLFENKRPEEIMSLLVNYYWKSEDGSDGMRFVYAWLNERIYWI